MMETISNTSLFTEALSEAMLHSLWQGVLLAMLLSLVLKFMGNARANRRYAVSVAALGLQVVLFTATFTWLLQQEQVQFQAVQHAAAGVYQLPPAESPQQQGLVAEFTKIYRQAVAFSRQYNYQIFLFWLLGSSLLLVRFASGLWYVHQLKQAGNRSIPLKWQCRLEKMARGMGIRRKVALVETSRVQVPTLAGWLRPVILLPFSMLSQMTINEIDGILAHELAHVKRHDYLVNLLQSLVEVALFFNPAVWWLSACVNEERENCCDDLALAQVANPKDYIQALAGLATRFHSSPVALSAAGSNGSVLFRIKRIVAKSGKQPFRGQSAARELTGRLAAASMLLLAGVLVLINSAFTPAEPDLLPRQHEVLAPEDTTKKYTVYFLSGDSTVVVKSDDSTVVEKFTYRHFITRDSLGQERSSTVNITEDSTLAGKQKPHQVMWLWGEGGVELKKDGKVDFSASDSVVVISLPQNRPDRQKEKVRIRHLKVTMTDSTARHPGAGKPHVVVVELDSIETSLKEAKDIFRMIDKGEINPDTINAALQRITYEKGAMVFHSPRPAIEGTGKDDVTIYHSPGATRKVTILGNRQQDPPMYILDGLEISSEGLNDIEPDDIASINVLKGKAATALYGERGENGVVNITTKNGRRNQPEVPEKVAEEPAVLKIGDVLIFIDGKERSSGEMEEIDPEFIREVHVLKGKSAIKKYGNRASNGVIEITLWKKTIEETEEEMAAEAAEKDSATVLKGAGTMVEGTKALTEGMKVLMDSVGGFSEGAEKFAGSLQVYPNPSDNDFTIAFTLAQPEQVKVTVTSLDGRQLAILANKKLGSGTHRFTWQAKGRPAGMYLINIYKPEGVYQQKVLFEGK